MGGLNKKLVLRLAQLRKGTSTCTSEASPSRAASSLSFPLPLAEVACVHTEAHHSSLTPPSSLPAPPSSIIFPPPRSYHPYNPEHHGVVAPPKRIGAHRLYRRRDARDWLVRSGSYRNTQRTSSRRDPRRMTMPYPAVSSSPASLRKTYPPPFSYRCYVDRGVAGRGSATGRDPRVTMQPVSTPMVSRTTAALSILTRTCAPSPPPASCGTR